MFVTRFIGLANTSGTAIVHILAKAHEEPASNQHRHGSPLIGWQESEMKIRRQHARCGRTN